MFLAVLTPCLHAQLKLLPDQVGLLTETPEYDVHIKGDLFVQSNFGGLMLGYPGTGNVWRMSTINGGQDILYRFRTQGTTNFVTRMVHFGNGDLAVGADPGFSNARLEVLHNSTISDPQVLLTEQANDFARLSFENTTNVGTRWTLAGYAGSTAAGSDLNFWFEDSNGGTDIVTIQGNGRVGIMGTAPTARLHLHQLGQSVGNGLRFDDGVNSDWDITHGFGLRLHYGGALRGFFDANTGAYTQSSDGRLKRGVRGMDKVLPKVRQLRPATYSYKDAPKRSETIGFIAQEVEPLFPELVEYSEVDDLYGINYAGFSVVAIKAIQELEERMQEREAYIEKLEERLARIEKMLTTGQTAQNYLLLDGEADRELPAQLKQNIPNPFQTVTTISYFIPDTAQSVQLSITDVAGNLLRVMDIEQRGQVQTILDGSAIAAGSYLYTLRIDGQVIGTKKMVINR